MTVQTQSIGRDEGVVVIGEATGGASLDSAELMLALRAAAPSVTQALREHATRTLTLTQTLTSKGVNPADIRTVAMNAAPVFAAPGQGASAYQVESSLRVTVHDPNRLGELLDALQLLGPHVTLGLWYRVADDSAARRATLDRAIKDARLKAQIAAAALGKQLGDPISVVEETNHGTSAAAASGVVATANGPAVVAGGESWMRVTVRVAYELA
jgi:uncharacterized protein YggE